MPYALVCFDMDGVLYSSEKMIAAAFRDAVREYAQAHGLDIPLPDLPEIMEQIGKPIRTIFSTLFPALDEAQQQAISVVTLQALVKRVRAKEGTLLPGVVPVLERLSAAGCRFGLASNGRAPYLDAILETYGLDRFFPERTVIDGVALPDKGSLIVAAMARHGIAADATLMVGDRLTDYEAARQAGVAFACVLSGHGNDFTDEPLEYTIHHLEELVPVVCGGVDAGV